MLAYAFLLMHVFVRVVVCAVCADAFVFFCILAHAFLLLDFGLCIVGLYMLEVLYA